jgi:hypothetical protein
VKVLHVYRQLYSSVGIAWSPYVSHRRDETRRVTPLGDAALASIRSAAPTIPTLAIDAVEFIPVPAFKSSF